MSGDICDKKVPEALKNKIYKTAIRPAMTYGGECWPIRKSDQRRITTTEMKMLRWVQGKTRKDHIRNTTIRENAHVQPMNTFLTKKRLSWFGHVQRREEHNIAKYVLATQVPGSRPRGRPKLRWMDRIKQDSTLHDHDLTSKKEADEIPHEHSEKRALQRWTLPISSE